MTALTPDELGNGFPPEDERTVSRLKCLELYLDLGISSPSPPPWGITWPAIRPKPVLGKITNSNSLSSNQQAVPRSEGKPREPSTPTRPEPRGASSNQEVEVALERLRTRHASCSTALRANSG